MNLALYSLLRYQFINIHQRTKTPTPQHRAARLYQFINIHQRTKTPSLGLAAGIAYQFINIHQRTKTIEGGSVRAFGISLSISIREPKQMNTPESVLNVSVYQYPSENQNSDAIIYFTSSVSVYQYPSENQNHRSFAPPCLAYQFINIHQRTKTYLPLYFNYLSISLSISIREPKPNHQSLPKAVRISLSISIREPKQFPAAALPL